MVEQLGFAIILSSAVNASALISGTTNFFVGSIRQALELSITVIPAAANLGAHSSDMVPPAEKMATSGCIAIAVSATTTVHCLPWKSIILPADFSDATGISSVIGKFRSVSTFIISPPTNPVAPTTATFISLSFKYLFYLYLANIIISKI